MNVSAIEACLPQTQCKECGYDGCLPYAQALAQGLTTIDHCPPGGVNTLNALAALLEIDPAPYRASVIAQTRPPALAVIREAECIGCTKCIQACPVDAIIGSAKLMHSVIAHECTGCGLCVEPCPVDCIDMVAQAEPSYDKALARKRYQHKQARELREQQGREERYREKRLLAEKTTDHADDKEAKQAYILQALARSLGKRRT